MTDLGITDLKKQISEDLDKLNSYYRDIYLISGLTIFCCIFGVTTSSFATVSLAPPVWFALSMYCYFRAKPYKRSAQLSIDLIRKHDASDRQIDGYLAQLSPVPIYLFSIMVPIFSIGSFFAVLMSSLRDFSPSWGRPLRIRGKVTHAPLSPGQAWISGELPNIEGLDEATAEALEALWTHDAKKEHASVPAFARLSWNLTAVGAPPELLRRVNLAANEEIDHTKKCLALAAGFRGRRMTFDDFPELLNEMNDVKGVPEVHLAKESFLDGCLLEEFNADIAALCAKECQDPASKAVLMQIAKEERSHATLSWDVVEFLMIKSDQVVAMLREEVNHLKKVQRPTAATLEVFKLVNKANPDLLLKYGRIPDERWAAMWEKRMQLVGNRMNKMISEHPSPSVSSSREERTGSLYGPEYKANKRAFPFGRGTLEGRAAEGAIRS